LLTINDPLAAAVLFGVAAGTICNFATQLKFILGYDDSLDASISLPSRINRQRSPTFFFVFFPFQIFASHAIGGVVGNLLTGFFAQKSVAAFDGITAIPGGWLDHHYIQLGYQAADSASGFGYSFVVTVRNPPLSFVLYDD
jgi:Amt family ammonium transporter